MSDFLFWAKVILLSPVLIPTYASRRVVDQGKYFFSIERKEKRLRNLVASKEFHFSCAIRYGGIAGYTKEHALASRAVGDIDIEILKITNEISAQKEKEKR